MNKLENWPEGWMFALWMIGAVGKAVIQAKMIGFTNQHFEAMIARNQARAIVHQMMREVYG